MLSPRDQGLVPPVAAEPSLGSVTALCPQHPARVYPVSWLPWLPQHVCAGPSLPGPPQIPPPLEASLAFLLLLPTPLCHHVQHSNGFRRRVVWHWQG